MTEGRQDKSSRILGYDLARAIAFIGMVFVNFKVVMGAGQAGPSWLIFLGKQLEGRAAAAFVVLAGVGISLLSTRARLSQNDLLIKKVKTQILWRALGLFVMGLLWSPIWPGDILHFYGVYLAISAFLLTSKNRTLVILCIGSAILFLVLLFTLDYGSGWNWKTLSYTGFYTWQGMIRRIFFNGFHPVFPWIGFLLLGMLIGRFDWSSPKAKRKLFFWGFSISLLANFASFFLMELSENIDKTLPILFGTSPMPPMPLYLLAAGGSACALIAVCLWFGEKFQTSTWLEAFVSTGQLSLTLYFAHVVFGMGFLGVFGLLENRSLMFAFTSAAWFSFLSVFFSLFWRRYYKRGPLEWILRRMSQPKKVS